MFDEFVAYLKAHSQLNDQEIERVYLKAIQKSIKRNDLLLREGEICRHKVFVVHGLLRTFGVSADGSEHILQFIPALSWTLDVESYDKQAPSKINIAAIESSDVLMWNKPDFEMLLAEMPQLKAFSQQLISRNIYNSRQRMLTILSATPEEKYEDFIQAYPDLLSKVPLRMIAAYLGISIKTLTRIRHLQSHR